MDAEQQAKLVRIFKYVDANTDGADITQSKLDKHMTTQKSPERDSLQHDDSLPNKEERRISGPDSTTRMRKYICKQFTTIDTNLDKQISEEEWIEFWRKAIPTRCKTSKEVEALVNVVGDTCHVPDDWKPDSAPEEMPMQSSSSSDTTGGSGVGSGVGQACLPGIECKADNNQDSSWDSTKYFWAGALDDGSIAAVSEGD